MNKTRYERRSDFLKSELNLAPAGRSETRRFSPEPLTAQESRVFSELMKGLSNRQIARILDLSEHTVKFHMKNLMAKFGVHSRMLLLVRSMRTGHETSNKRAALGADATPVVSM